MTGVCLSSLGHDVVLRDIDPARIDGLKAGRIPIYEPGLEDLIAENAERLTFTLDVAELLERSDIVFVAVDTPPTYSGDADLSRVMTAIAEMGRSGLGPRHTIVMKSTVPVGTGDRVRGELDALGHHDVGYASNPEFLKEGAAIADFLMPDRVVIGAFRQEDSQRVADLYASMDAPIVRTDVATAEMIKYASNAFLATKISFINEIANVCEEVGADVVTVADGMGYDSRIGRSFLNAGIGFGGSCFPKDVSALKQLAGNSGYHFQLLTAVIEVNELQKRRVIGKLKKHLDLAGATIALLGVAFKPGTDDIREAASLVLASRLLAEGARVRVSDPVALDAARGRLGGVEFVDDAREAARGAQAVVLVTEWPEIVSLDWAAVVEGMEEPRLVVDGRNVLDGTVIRAAGGRFEAIGRGVAGAGGHPGGG